MTIKELNIGENIIKFQQLGDEEHWLWKAQIKLHNKLVSIEIDSELHIQQEIDWIHCKNFITFFIEKENIFEIVESGKNLLNELGQSFYKRDPDIMNWKMESDDCIYYNGRPDVYNNVNKYLYSISHTFSCNDDEYISGDEYGIYLLDICNLDIVGARRVEV